MAPGRSSSPIRPLVVLGIISLMAGLASLFLVRIFHRPLGLLGDYKVREAYHCDTLRVRTDHFSLEIHGGMCIPGYRDGIITGLAVLGDGEFVFPVPMQYYSRYRVDKVRDSLDIAYFAIHPDDYETLKTLNGFYPAQTENYVDTARVIFSRNKRTSYNFNGWGMIPVKGGLNCRMYTRNLGVVHHFEAHEIALSSASR
ncbi:hypothetical protein IBX73_03850, partial [candidate division WOR-3 bacterium]|nr:hypothetical protein [candidate division WOR-3 bacterium]